MKRINNSEKEKESADHSSTFSEDVQKNRQNTDKEEKNTGDNRLTYKYSTAALAVLVFILITFFVGSEHIEKQRNLRLSSAETTAVLRNDTATETDGALVNINTADMYELMQLDDIGEKRAAAIIEYRNEYGRFIEIEDIMNIPGIGQSVFDGIKDKITA